MEKGTLKDGNGTRITYYVNGQKESEGTFKSGKAEGLWIFYHENGRKASEGTMIDGKKRRSVEVLQPCREVGRSDQFQK
ncbi:hypothetical protein [Algoriphagus boritolerans]|uniref:toxin-antitoxin system YwqK family antitoxin n=1 Tax=Algoriphagus boritolerans TaxID=308111 RepID=UPI000AFCF1BC